MTHAWNRTVMLRLGVIVALLAIAFVRCGAILPGAADASGGPGGSGSVPGVTSSTVKVAFLGVNLASTEKALGFTVAPQGNLAQEATAVQNYVNAHGGIAGRKMQALYVNYDAAEDSPQFEDQTCEQITEDDHVFAVVLLGQLLSTPRPCYAQHHTLMLDETLTTSSQQLYQQLAPYLWSPDYPSADSFASTFITDLEQRGFFAGQTKVGFVSADTPVNHEVWSNVAQPLLAKYHLTGVVEYVDPNSIATITTGSVTGAENLASAGVHRVGFLGGSRIASIFLIAAPGQGLTNVRYAISTYDSPGFMATNPKTDPPSVLQGMIGIGFGPNQEVNNAQLAFPQPGGEQLCVNIMKAGGVTFTQRDEMQTADAYCDAGLLLSDGAKNLSGNLSAGSWAKAVQTLGTSFAPASGFGTDFTNGIYAGAAYYRDFQYENSCDCFAYTSANKPFNGT